MRSTPHVSRVRLLPATEELQATGLLGWVTFRLDRRFQVEGVTLRRTAQGQLTISFPYREDDQGFRWHYLQPLDEETRRAIERQVIAQLRGRVA